MRFKPFAKIECGFTNELISPKLSKTTSKPSKVTNQDILRDNTLHDEAKNCKDDIYMSCKSVKINLNHNYLKYDSKSKNGYRNIEYPIASLVKSGSGNHLTNYMKCF